MVKAVPPEETGPEPVPAQALRDLETGQPRVARAMQGLSADPPQVLILEGGTAPERLAAAMYWAVLCNCPMRDPGMGQGPCLDCPDCVRLLSFVHRDLFFYDGSQGSIRIDDMRALRPVLGDPPREARTRVILLAAAQSLTTEAANSLLKSLEEPRPGNTFLLLAPQRERLLPTLVSRGFVLTLSWPDAAKAASDVPEDVRGRVADWRRALADFCVSGRGWFEHTSTKGAADAFFARRLVLGCQADLAAAMCGSPASTFARLLGDRLTPENVRRADVLFGECQEALESGVNPILVLDWMASRLHGLVRGQVRPPYGG